MERFYLQFGHLLRSHRERSGLNQSALGSAVGLSRTSITNIERGRQRLPLHIFAEIVRVLEVDPALLLPKPVDDESSLKPRFEKALADREASLPEREAVLRVDRRLEKGPKA